MKRLLATSLFTTAAYMLTLLAGQPAARADVPGGVVSPPLPALLSPATAALRDGDDIRARGLAGSPSESLQHTASLFTLSPATAALADGDDIRARV